MNVDSHVLKAFPHTNAALKLIPGAITAFFSVLPPRKMLPQHIGPYKGVWRYHLGLITPLDYKKCYINVNGKIYHWKEGEDVIFDDTYPHYVENRSRNESRVVLFVDLKRDFRNVFVNLLNDLFIFISGFHQRPHSIMEKQNSMGFTLS